MSRLDLHYRRGHAHLQHPADATVPVFGSPTNWYFQISVMVLIMIPQILINIYGIRITARLNDSASTGTSAAC